MIKKLMILVTSFAFLGVLSGCGNQLTETFDEEVVSQKAEQVVLDVFADDYEAVWELFGDAMKESFGSLEAFESLIQPVIEEVGAYVETSGIAVVGEQVDSEDIAVAVLRVEAENQSLQFTVSFTEEMEIVGFFIQ